MGRRKVVAIDKEIKDDVVEQYISSNPEELIKDTPRPTKMSSSVQKVIRMAEELYKSEGNRDLDEVGLYDLQKAYDYLRERGVNLSFRAFGGRIERGSIPSVKIGNKRYIYKDVLDNLVQLENGYYTVRRAYNVYKKVNPRINYRAFIGRVEKGTIPSVKVGGKRYIPAKVVDTFLHLERNYYSVSQALEELSKHGIKINRNAFERRLDRGRIPHYKVGGRRYIHKDVLNEVIQRELQRKK